MLHTEPIPLDGSVNAEGKGKGAKSDEQLNREAIDQHMKVLLHEYRFYDFLYPPTYAQLSILEQYHHETRVTPKTFIAYEKLIKENPYEVNELRYRDWENQLRIRIPTKKHQSHELGPREFTLTYSSKWFDDDKARNHMTKAIQRLISYNSHVIKEFRAVGEFASQSHVHCYYHLEGGLKIPDKHFKRAYPWWDTSVKLSKTGHQGGHHALVQDIGNFKSYIDKDAKDAWLDISKGEDPEN